MSSAPPVTLASLLVLSACAGSAPRSSTTPTHRPPAAAPEATAPPRIHIALTGSGATVTVDDGDDARCVRLGEASICGQGTVNPRALRAHLLEGGWVLPADTLTVEGDLELQVAEGIEALGPPDAPVAYLSPGPHTQRLRDAGWIDQPPLDAGLPEERLAPYEQAAVALEAWLGAPRQRVLLLPGTEVALPGVVTEAERPTAAMVRAWLEGGPDWWQRGVGDYLAMLVDHRAGELSADAAYDELLMRYTRHRDAPGESPASAEGPVAADVGALVAFCVDVELRIRTTSLPAMLADLGEGPLEAAAFAARLSRDHPEIGRHHLGRVQRRGVVELDSCLRRGGRKLLAHEVPVVDPARLLRVGELDEDGRVARGGSGPLRTGDQVQHVRGQAVRRAWDIVFYLRDLGGRHRFSVSVQRGERTLRTWLRMVAIDEDLPTRIRFTAAEDMAADPEGDPFRAPADDRR